MTDRVEDLLEPGNGWAERVRGRLTALPPELTGLVLHLATSSESWNWRGKIEGGWKRRTKALLKADGAREVVYDAIRALAEGGSLHDCTDPNATVEWLRDTPTRALATGFALAAGCVGDKGAVVERTGIRKGGQAAPAMGRPPNRMPFSHSTR